jgi:putative membrane protein
VDLLVGTILLRPYVFAFLAAFIAAGSIDIGVRRTALFAACIWPVALVAELSSTRTGVPFGLYHYTGQTRGRELFISDVPFMDSLSFVFLAYASFCLARAALGSPSPSATLRTMALASLSGVLMMLLDMVIDPAAVLGDRWFLGRIFYYPESGIYFGVPLSNFAGWALVGTLGTGLYLRVAPKNDGRERPWPGVALYYAVLAFNLAVTAWIGEWMLFTVGASIHAAVAGVLRSVSNQVQ